MQKAAKIFLMKVAAAVADFWGLFKKKNSIGQPKRIAILFFKNLGIGDLLMLSPAIQRMIDIFPSAKIHLATWPEKFIDFKNIDWISPEEYKKTRKNFDLVVSPTICLRHWPEIFFAKNWLGYFSWLKLQANFPIEPAEYNLTREHYLWRGIRLIKALNLEAGEEMEGLANNKQLIYPTLATQEMPCFQAKLAGRKYLSLAPVSKSPDRQWPLESFAETARFLLEEKFVEKIVFLGDNSDWDKDFINRLREKLADFPDEVVFNAAGRTILPETVFLIKNSEIFIGLDSSPAHFAYLVAKRALAIFVNVRPEERRPLEMEAGKTICLTPEFENFDVYTGLGRADKNECQKMAASISVERVKKAIGELFS